MTCPLCKGEMLNGKSSLPFEKGENLLVVRDVPTLICSQCGEPFIEIKNVRIVERIIATAEKDGMLLGFIKFKSAA